MHCLGFLEINPRVKRVAALHAGLHNLSLWLRQLRLGLGVVFVENVLVILIKSCSLFITLGKWNITTSLRAIACSCCAHAAALQVTAGSSVLNRFAFKE